MKNKEILRTWISIKVGASQSIDFFSFREIFFPTKEISFVKERYKRYTDWFTKLSHEKINEIIQSVLPDLSSLI